MARQFRNDSCVFNCSEQSLHGSVNLSFYAAVCEGKPRQALGKGAGRWFYAAAYEGKTLQA